MIEFISFMGCILACAILEVAAFYIALFILMVFILLTILNKKYKKENLSLCFNTSILLEEIICAYFL